MEPSLWQKFWRWIVVMEIVAFVIAVWRGMAYADAVKQFANSKVAFQPGSLDAAAGALFWDSVTYALMIAMLFSFVMWWIVEAHAWWNRRRDRAELNRYERRASFRP